MSERKQEEGGGEQGGVGRGRDVKTGVWKTGGYKLVEMDQR